MSEIYKLFKESKNFSTKYSKYFKIYDEIFLPYKDRKIIFVEIGVYNGGSLEIWKKFFNKESRIIGIDINPECKKLETQGYEIFIGDQTDKTFWENFFKTVGNVDIVLDDGGHRNEQQINTVINCIPNINNGGIIAVEDTHTSYMKDFTVPKKYSFINFSKKIIDDVNFTYPNIGKFKFSLNKYIHSINFYESFVVFKIDRNLTTFNELLGNEVLEKKIEMHDKILIDRNIIEKKYLFIFRIKFFRKILRYFIKIKKFFLNKKLKKYFH